MTHTLTALLHGTALTLSITACSLALGFIAAVLWTYLLQSQARPLKLLSHAYVISVRGTPLLLQLFFVYYGLGQLTPLQHSPIWPLLKNPLACGILVLANNSMAYVSNLLHGIIKNIPATQSAAACQLGFSQRQQFIWLQLPYAIRQLWPFYQNEMLILLKSSSLLSTITVLELTGCINQIVSLQYHHLLWYSLAAVIYISISSGLTLLVSSCWPAAVNRYGRTAS